MPHQLFQLGIKALINVEDEYLFLSRVRTKDSIHFFDIPGGRIEKAVDGNLTGTIENTLQRELEEELGASLHIDTIQKAVQSPLTFSLLERLTHDGSALAFIVYRIELPEKPVITLSDEHNGYRWVAKSDLESLLHDEIYEANDIIERVIKAV